MSLSVRCFFNDRSKQRLSATECNFKYELTRTKQDVVGISNCFTEIHQLELFIAFNNFLLVYSMISFGTPNDFLWKVPQNIRWEALI